MFYDNFTPSQVAGLFSVWHIVFILIFIVMLFVSLNICKNKTDKQVEKIIFYLALIVTVAEIIKISLRILKNGGVDSWIPLYYCSLFLYAIWMTKSKSENVNRTGYSYITMGGIMASCLYVLYPSTSLALYPAWHPASIHSLLYHFAMAFIGILILWKGLYIPNRKDSILYGIYVFIACLIGYFINELTGSNCMFLHNAFKLPILDDLLVYSHGLYILLVVLAQAVGMFWLNYGIYNLIKKAKGSK